MTLEEKIANLRRIIHDYGRVAVAFSGGVDSSLLLKCALDSLGAGNVLVLHGKSCLQKEQEQQSAASWLRRHGFNTVVALVVIDLEPLLWKEFVPNLPERCYLCKLRMYKRFFEEAEKHAIHCLLDATNSDDLKDNRPGFRAIHQLGVKTPLVAAGLSKSEVREASRNFELDTWDHPSASCLATRIPHHTPITKEKLERVIELEAVIETLGFNGCRVRLGETEESVQIEVAAEHIETIAAEINRVAVLHAFKKQGVSKVYLDLVGR
jgi:uncharacterized protein